MTTALHAVTGRFYRAIRADRLAAVLDPPLADGTGRYHRPGQSALYVTPQADWAAIAIGRYWLADGAERMIVPLDIDHAALVDQRDPAACAALGIDRDASDLGWQQALAAGQTPPSWRASDIARAAGADGLIDRSRGIAGGWHVTLFHWNRAGAPTVTLGGDALACDYGAARARWAAPDGWIDPRGR